MISQDPIAGEIKAKTGATLKSWGEDISIKTHREPTGTTISVTSEATSQLFDWGKSRENERAFLEQLKKKTSR